MNKQRGGTVTVNGYLLALLIGAGVVSAATNLWLASHRTIEIDFSCGAPSPTAYPSKPTTASIRLRASARIFS